MWCMSYLEYVVPHLKKEIAAQLDRGEPADKRKRALYLECMKRKGSISNAIEGGSMTIDAYVDQLKLIKGKDEKLIPYFTAKGMTAQANICKERLKYIDEELADM